MDRPADLFDREHEWADLSAFAARRGAGTHLALVRGRRRQGKSFLLRRLTQAVGGFYHQAAEQQRGQALASLGAAIGEFSGVPGGRLALDTWDDAIGALGDLAHADRPMLVVIDEFPYLLDHSPELPSLLQKAIDRSRDGGPALRFVLCGSALSTMATLLTGTQALRGRASLDVVVGPFDYRQSARFWGIAEPRAAFNVHAVLGGTPGYRDLLSASPPRRLGDFGSWLAAGPLNPSSALFREDGYLLTEERSLTDRALYHSVLTAVADGHTSQGAIAEAVGREQRAVQHPLRALEEAGFLARSEDALRSRRPIYAVADPIVRFHHVVTRRDLARFEDRRTSDAWADAQPRFATHVLGPHFEELARQFAFKFAAASTVGGTASMVAPAVVNDARGRAQHEVDVVVTQREPNGGQSVIALGEAKHTSVRRSIGDLNRLEQIRDLVAAKHPSAASARLLLFSANGFERNLVSDARRRNNIELIDLDRMYTGD